jgi:hypothetical protein
MRLFAIMALALMLSNCTGDRTKQSLQQAEPQSAGLPA